MKVVVAIDSFKGSLSASQACGIVAEAIRSERPGAKVLVMPMADGGEGTASVLMTAAEGRWLPRRVMGPLAEMQVEAGFAWLPDSRTAVVETASASGLGLLRRDQLDPLKATTYGTGQLIGAAVDRGAQAILLAVGGSATVDGGIGAAMALGWKFLTPDGSEVALGGGQLSRISEIVPPSRGVGIPVDVLCDVDNPLCGPHGAAAVFGPQKGATTAMVGTLDSGLAHLAALVREQLGSDIVDLPGAGAAGGLAAGAVAFMEARLTSGIETVMSQCGLPAAVADADWVITGEGRFDDQSLRGKVVSGVARVARERGARVGVIAGQVRLSHAALRLAGIDAALACMSQDMEIEYALAHSRTLLAEAAREFARRHLAC
jgi:glycerate kinase